MLLRALASASLVAATLFGLTSSSVGSAATLPTGFHETVVFSGLTEPSNIRFASDGRVFVAEKSGLVKVFDNLSDSTPTTFADLRTNVYNFWDRGLLGLELHPNFPATPVRLRPLHVRPRCSAAPRPPPRWGTPGATSDPCPTPPGPTTDGCVVERPPFAPPGSRGT